MIFLKYVCSARGTIILVVFLLSLLRHYECTCTWPTVLNNSVWEDSRKGDLTFKSTSMSGYTVDTIYTGQSFTGWECYNDTYFASENLLMIRSTGTVDILGKTWYGYLCWQMTTLTDVSFMYYTLAAKQVNAKNVSIYINFNTTTPNRTQICNTMDGASELEFNVMVKQGQGATAAQKCPRPLLGRFDFNYTTPDGALTCTSRDHVNVCSNKTVITADTPCSGQSMVYADGDVYCVYDMTVGTNTYVQLYNPQVTVDRTTTYRFSCMAISEDSSVATIVYDACATDQTPTNTARDANGNVIGATLTLYPYAFCQGGCTWPSDFAGTTWYDNRHGTAVFDSADVMTGWSIAWVGDGNVAYDMNQWECLDMSDFTNGAGGTLVFKGTQNFNGLSTDWNIYMCLEFTYLTNSSYLYYQRHPTQTLVNNERVQVSSTTTVLTTSAAVCTNPIENVPMTEFQVMVKSGTESHAKRDCTSQMFTRSDYTHTADNGTTVTCDTSLDNWDVCTDRGIMEFNYTTCNTQMAYSAAGLVYCVFSLTSGSNTYQLTFNSDASPTYRFACFVINSGGTAASMVYNECTSGQTPTTLANDGTNDIGALLTMEPFFRCPYPSDGGDDSGGVPLAAIAGAGVGILLLIVAAVIAYLWWRKHKRRKNSVNNNDKDPERTREKTRSPTPDTNQKPTRQENGTMTMEEVEEDPNPALHVEPKRNTLTPLQKNRPLPQSDGVTPSIVPPIRT